MEEVLKEDEIEEILKENEALKERIKTLENMLSRSSSSSSAYNKIREMIIEKVMNEVEQPAELEEWMNKDTRSTAERQLMSDLKWELRVRHVTDFRTEHIEPAKEYIDNYVIPEDLKKSKWVGV